MSASGDFGPAPPDVDLTENQTDRILGTVISIGSLGILAVCMRLVARFKSGNSLGIDDYTLVLALVRSFPPPMNCVLYNSAVFC